jgi:hypothetical protein
MIAQIERTISESIAALPARRVVEAQRLTH